jgi:hypothetical protein
MKKRTTICLELTDSQLLHLTRLAGALDFNRDITIKELNFPKEFRNVFRDLFWENPHSQYVSESAGMTMKGLQPTELMRFVTEFHRKTKIK